MFPGFQAPSQPCGQSLSSVPMKVGLVNSCLPPLLGAYFVLPNCRNMNSACEGTFTASVEPMTTYATQSMPRQRFSVVLLERTWKLERHGDLESLWDAMGEGQQTHSAFVQDERLPYWTELWPSSLLLGRYLGQRREQVDGSLCLDLGCGLGLTALAGACLGGRVLAADYEWPAVAFARGNVHRNLDKLNGAVLPVQMDWRAPALKRGAFRCIWGGDVMYERRIAQPLQAVLEHALAPQGCAWIAEPGREIFSSFVSLMRARGWRCEPVLQEKTPQITAPGPPASVTVWELTRPS